MNFSKFSKDSSIFFKMYIIYHTNKPWQRIRSTEEKSITMCSENVFTITKITSFYNYRLKSLKPLRNIEK